MMNLGVRIVIEGTQTRLHRLLLRYWVPLMGRLLPLGLLLLLGLPLLLGLLLLLGGIWITILFFFRNVPFIPGPVLHASTWIYSAPLSLGLGIAISVAVARSHHLKREGDRAGRLILIVLAPVLVYVLVGATITRSSALLAHYFADRPYAEVLVIERITNGYRSCFLFRKQVSFRARGHPYPYICVSEELASRLRPGDELLVEGRQGFGGAVIERYRPWSDGFCCPRIRSTVPAQ